MCISIGVLERYIKGTLKVYGFIVCGLDNLTTGFAICISFISIFW